MIKEFKKIKLVKVYCNLKRIIIIIIITKKMRIINILKYESSISEIRFQESRRT